MPTKQRSAEGPISPELVLAAIERARRHKRNLASPGVLRATVEEHLGLSRDGGSTRRLRPTWKALHAEGLIEYTRRKGLNLWALTMPGAQRLAAARRSGQLPALPESPQHREWREARGAAAAQVASLREDLRTALVSVGNLLDVPRAANSDAWYAAARLLGNACCHLGSATHCLDEWPEPDDAHADVVPEAHRGRRDYRRWAKPLQ